MSGRNDFGRLGRNPAVSRHTVFVFFRHIGSWRQVSTLPKFRQASTRGYTGFEIDSVCSASLALKRPWGCASRLYAAALEGPERGRSEQAVKERSRSHCICLKDTEFSGFPGFLGGLQRRLRCASRQPMREVGTGKKSRR